MCDDGPMTQRLRGGFRYIDMTPNAWAAVIVPGAVAGLAAARLWDVSPVGPVVGGVVLSWLLALVVDRWAGGRALVTLDVSDLSEPGVQAVVARLDADRVPVTVRRWHEPGTDPDPDTGPPARAALRVPRRHRDQASTAVEAERQRLTGGGRP